MSALKSFAKQCHDTRRYVLDACGHVCCRRPTCCGNEVRMPTTCILVVGLPLSICLFFAIYAIFIVPGLEMQLRERLKVLNKEKIEILGQYGFEPREYL